MPTEHRGSLLKVVDFTVEEGVPIVVVGDGNALPEKPEWVACDCCMAHVDRVWVTRYRGFCCRLPTGVRYELAAGEWAFCVFCWQLAREGDWKTLVARVVTLNQSLDTASVEKIYGILPSAMYGTISEWRSGMRKPGK